MTKKHTPQPNHYSTQVYQFSKKYVEMDIDISVNSTASYICGMVQPVTRSLTIDFGFVLEVRRGGRAGWRGEAGTQGCKDGRREGEEARR